MFPATDKMICLDCGHKHSLMAWRQKREPCVCDACGSVKVTMNGIRPWVPPSPPTPEAERGELTLGSEPLPDEEVEDEDDEEEDDAIDQDEDEPEPEPEEEPEKPKARKPRPKTVKRRKR